MLNWVALLGLMAVAPILFSDPAAGQEEFFEEPWQQIESNAGACPKCRISIARKATSLSVVANNGWSAVVRARSIKDPTEAIGTGGWAPGKVGTAAGRPFHVVFHLADQRLYMSMRVEMEDGSIRLIKAVFARVWFGA